MKRILAIVALSALFASCSKEDKIAQLTVTDRVEYKIEAGIAVNTPVEIYTPPIFSDANRELSLNNTKAELVRSVSLQEFRMVITQPFGGSWNFLKDIEVFIDADQLPEKRIAFETNLTDQINAILLLKPDQVELAEYLKKGAYIIKTRITTDKELNNDVNVQITSKYVVGAKVPGS